MRLGKWEKAVLVACLEHSRRERGHGHYAPDLWRDELPAFVFGLTPREKVRGLSRDWDRPALRYTPGRELNNVQATLTRTLQSLFRKDLIDAGHTWEATDVRVYCERRAKELGRETDTVTSERWTDEELDRVRVQPITGKRFTLRHSTLVRHTPEHNGRNMKAIRLTKAGRELAQTLSPEKISELKK